MTATFTLPRCPQCRHRDDEVQQLQRKVADLTRQLAALRHNIAVCTNHCTDDTCDAKAVTRLDATGHADLAALEGWVYRNGWLCPKHREDQP